MKECTALDAAMAVSAQIEENKKEVTVAELDALCQELTEREAEKEVIAASLSEKNKEIARLESKAKGYLTELNRRDYVSPSGALSIKTDTTIKMPSTPEEKAKLWAWMREKGIYDAYATVHATSLKSLFLSERTLALEEGGDPITFALPGMEPAKEYESVKFKPKKK